MKTLFRLSRRRLLTALGVLALLFGLAMLHPYPRQSLFGPTIRGRPWCVWENDIRRAANHGRPTSLWDVALAKIGLLERPRLNGVMQHQELLPVLLCMADDTDADVRRFCLWSLERRTLIDEHWRWSEEQEAEILPVMRKHLHDDDPVCRLIAAEYLWRATRDREMIQVPYAYLNHADPMIHEGACIALCYLAEADPESIDAIAKMVWDAKLKKNVRTTALQSMRHFGKRGLPILERGLKDADNQLRYSAMWAAREMVPPPVELVPSLLPLRQDADPLIRKWAGITLTKLDPKRFPRPASAVD